MLIEFSPRKSLLVLLSIIALLVLANIAGIFARFAFDEESLFGLVGLFDLHSERNIPTLFSSLQLTLAGLLLFLIGRKHQSNGKKYIAWIVLAAIFLFLAIDETAAIHERLGDPLRSVLSPGGFFYFPWVIPYGIAVLLILVCFSRFLMQLPKPINTWFLASGAIYIGGALGSEMLGARHKELFGSDNISYALYYTVEETLEMLGIALFIYALLKYACITFQNIKISVQE